MSTFNFGDSNDLFPNKTSTLKDEIPFISSQNPLPYLENSSNLLPKQFIPSSKSKSRKGHSSKRFSTKSSNLNQFKDKEYIEKEITKKIEQYRLSLNQELLELLAEERRKEDSRERMLKDVESVDERAKLEKLFNLERTQSSNKIEQFNK
jgi:hypothetical protein